MLNSSISAPSDPFTPHEDEVLVAESFDNVKNQSKVSYNDMKQHHFDIFFS